MAKFKLKQLIAVIGGGEADNELLKEAEEVGRGLAKAGFIVLTGGLGGVMEAASRGAKAEGGLTIGILPGSSVKDANAYVDVALPTGMGDMRNALIVRAASGLIALGGGYGTLSEFALAIKAGLPIVAFNTWEITDAVIKVETPEEAVEAMVKAVC